MKLRALFLLMVALLLAGCGSAAQPTATTRPTVVNATSAVPTSGSPVEPPRLITDFAMPSSTGGTLGLKDFKGEPTLIFFGYTYCPDICPATLAEFKTVKRALGEQGDDVNYVFISVDAARDTPERLNEYVSAFDPSFVGLSGTSETLKPIAKDFNLRATMYENPNDPENYPVEHTAAAFLLDKDGQLRMVYAYGTPGDVLAADVRHLLTASP